MRSSKFKGCLCPKTTKNFTLHHLAPCSTLQDMGFCESEVRKALAECVWDVNRALDLLVSRGAVALAPLPKSDVRGGQLQSLLQKLLSLVGEHVTERCLPTC